MNLVKSTLSNYFVLISIIYYSLQLSRMKKEESYEKKEVTV
jgi:hypothetical protein